MYNFNLLCDAIVHAAIMYQHGYDKRMKLFVTHPWTAIHDAAVFEAQWQRYGTNSFTKEFFPRNVLHKGPAPFRTAVQGKDYEPPFTIEKERELAVGRCSRAGILMETLPDGRVKFGGQFDNDFWII